MCIRDRLYTKYIVLCQVTNNYNKTRIIVTGLNKYTFVSLFNIYPTYLYLLYEYINTHIYAPNTHENIYFYTKKSLHRWVM